ncbi:MAG TPA: 16S rRNA (adenine(1518)-N(6)/adenine(1519)-N(6))-dimethyltransferase RsmA [Arenibaculum sp.]|nr:16S rRNA (adenine(1518)-N(6)/adenine(1519)-N(6))-dimethyltransferase RsmA [Arenibaculum sp.]
MGDVGGLPPLRDVIARFDLGARKALGQNFLLDLNLTARIARAAGDLAGVTVVEIGPGPGGLTRALVATDARAVVAVERDPRFVEALRDLVDAADGRLTLVRADALEIDPADLVPAPRAVVANLPYNVATPLLIGWLKRIEEYRSLTLMFQKEVADRIVAKPDTKAYGRLSVIVQWRAQAHVLFNLPARAFTPPPKVMSTVVQLVPRTEREPAEWEAMEKVTAAAFGQRRKMLRQSLKTLGPGMPGGAEALIEAAGLEPTARAEEIPVAGFAALAREWRARTPAASDRGSG